jgi:hypothetical protein
MGGYRLSWNEDTEFEDYQKNRKRWQDLVRRFDAMEMISTDILSNDANDSRKQPHRLKVPEKRPGGGVFIRGPVVKSFLSFYLKTGN